MLTYNFCVSWY